MEFSRQEYWSGLPFTPPGDLPRLGIEPMSPEAVYLEEIKRRDTTKVSKPLNSADCTRIGNISACSWPVPGTESGPLE